MICDIQEKKKITLNYESYMYDNGLEEHDKDHHEIYPNMVDDIIKSLKN